MGIREHCYGTRFNLQDFILKFMGKVTSVKTRYRRNFYKNFWNTIKKKLKYILDIWQNFLNVIVRFRLLTFVEVRCVRKYWGENFELWTFEITKTVLLLVASHGKIYGWKSEMTIKSLDIQRKVIKKKLKTE